jgi:hypothetical protein
LVTQSGANWPTSLVQTTLMLAVKAGAVEKKNHANEPGNPKTANIFLIIFPLETRRRIILISIPA